MNKIYLKELFRSQLEVEQRIDELRSIEAAEGCTHCHQSGHQRIDAEIRGLQVAQTHIDAAINNYLAHHGGRNS